MSETTSKTEIMRLTKEQIADRLIEAGQKHEEFRQEVRRVAIDYAETHGWCNEVYRALEEMGLGPDPITVRFVVTHEVTLKPYTNECDEDSLRRSVTGFFEHAVEMDEDFFEVVEAGESDLAVQIIEPR